MHKLIIEDDEGRTTVVPVVRDQLTIGRMEGNTIRLTERNVSRKHARLFRQDGNLVLEDLNSYTGVRVNSTRISAPTVVKDGDQIQIGDYSVLVRTQAPADAIPATRPGLPAALGDGSGVPGASPAPGAAPPPVPAAAMHQANPSGVAKPNFEAAPTMPLRTLEGAGNALPIPGVPVPRVVVVTSDLAGTEFRLDRPSLVIGRTEENDIILNHPSISRHHAKIVRDGDRYTVVDLQSANGVRVGGESYERIDLQPGDVIELGHVKVRFVGPFETWVFNPAEYAPRPRRGLKIGAAVGGVVLATVVVLLLRGGHKDAAPPVAESKPVAPAGPSPESVLEEANAAVGAENWDQAVTRLDLLLSRPTEGMDPTVRSRAQALKGRVDMERRSAEAYASFEEAVNDKEPDVALSRYEALPDGSVYKVRAQPALDGVKELFVAAHLELAEAARSQGRCDEANGEAEKVQEVDPENATAHDIQTHCRPRGAPAAAHGALAAAGVVRAPRAAARPVPAARPVAARSPARAVDDEDPVPTGEQDASELLKQAREAWTKQECASAITLSRKALKLRPGANDAYQIIAVCACSSRDRDTAEAAYAKLDTRTQSMVKTLCARNGVDLE